jgi:hypothetical protein
MAIANSYPVGTPKAADLLLGTSVPTPGTDEKATTKNFPVSAISTAIGISYNSYVSLVTQTGTNAPTIEATLANTTGGDPTWAYESNGVYTLTFPFAFADETKVIVFVNNGNVSPTQNIGWALTGVAGQIRLNTQNDDNMSRASLEIRIYA